MSRDIATLTMQRTYGIARITVDHRGGYHYYTPTLLLDGRPTCWDNSTSHQTYRTAQKHLARFAAAVEQQFAQPIEIIDTGLTTSDGEQMWDYVAEIQRPATAYRDAHSARLHRRCYFSKRHIIVSEQTGA